MSLDRKTFMAVSSRCHARAAVVRWALERNLTDAVISWAVRDVVRAAAAAEELLTR
jgi:hypothetical protein